MGVKAEGMLRVCQGEVTAASLGYPLSVLNKNSTLKSDEYTTSRSTIECVCWCMFFVCVFV